MKHFELPSNVKQIGTIGEGMKIYIEDYVHTYLNQYADVGGSAERIAFLVGKQLVIDSVPYLFVSGAVAGKDTIHMDGIETFSKKSYQYATQQISKYFSGFDIVGLMQSQPGYGVSLNPFYAEYHMENFPERHDVMFVVDPIERSSQFYVWNEDQSALVESSGYFVYYDKNEGMNEYMLENKQMSRPKEKETKPAVTFRRDESGAKREGASRRMPISTHIPTTSSSGPMMRTIKPIQPAPLGGRMLGVLTTLSCILCVLSFVLGSGLLRSQDRIAKLEDNIAIINTSYNYLASQLKQVASMPVFAPVQSDNSEEIAKGQQSPETTATTPTSPTAGTSSSPAINNQTPATTPVTTPANTNTTPATTPSTKPSTSPSTNSGVSQIQFGNIPETYIVEKGDSLIGISRKFYGDESMVEAIMELNELENADTIYFGKKLKLPQE